MRSNSELKEAAKTAFRSNYWLLVGIIVVTGSIIGMASGVSANFGEWTVSVSSIVATAFLGGPIAIGLTLFLAMFLRGNPDAKFGMTFEYGFSGGRYWRHVGAYMWMVFKTFLWTLLFIVPGIIKSFAYAMDPYIVAMFPNVAPKEALKLSERIMMGNKGRLFGLWISFIGWYILSGITCGIVYIFWVGPYVNLTITGFFEDLMRESIEKGVVSREELGIAA